MEKTIRWFGGVALLAAAGIAAVLSSAAAEDILLPVEGTDGVLTAAQESQLAAAASCWQGTAAGIEGTQVERRANGVLSITVVGTRVLSRAEARARLLELKALEPGRALRETVTCEVTAGARASALVLALGAHWGRSVDTLAAASFRRDTEGLKLNYARGLAPKDIDEALDDNERGVPIRPAAAVVEEERP